MHFDIVTLFPEMFAGVFSESIIKRAREAGLVTISLHDLREYAAGRHRVTDDTPYGGGGGMVMKAAPIFDAVEAVLGDPLPCPLIMMTPQGRPFTIDVARELAALPHIALLCGRYEGFDERVREHLVTDQISIGDFVLTGGELPALMIIDAVSRFIPGVLGDPDGADDDSFASGLLEYPQYTKPEDFRGWKVPEVLLSGNHVEINKWRRRQSLLRTLKGRPDILAGHDLNEVDKKWLAKFDENGEEQ